MFKGIGYLIIMNIAVMGTMYAAMFLLGLFGINIQDYIGGQGYTGLFIFALIFGFGGAFISLFISKWMTKKTMRVKLIDENSYGDQRWVYKRVENLAKKAGIGMPEVGIYEGAPNAFATGWNRNNALVAVSTGLINKMSHEEIEGILAHEIAHVKNGDMITMTLMQGVLNTFVIFLARIVGGIIDKAIFKNEEGVGIGYYVTVLVLEMLFSLLASIILMAYSRHREYRADEGAVDLNGQRGIYNALAKLGSVPQKQLALPDNMKAFGIVGMLGLFRSHPPIEKRLKNIEKYKG